MRWALVTGVLLVSCSPPAAVSPRAKAWSHLAHVAGTDPAWSVVVYPTDEVQNLKLSRDGKTVRAVALDAEQEDVLARHLETIRSLRQRPETRCNAPQHWRGPRIAYFDRRALLFFISPVGTEARCAHVNEELFAIMRLAGLSCSEAGCQREARRTPE